MELAQLQGDDMRNPDFNTAQRLYELLDTLVAMRMDFGAAPNTAQDLEVFGPAKMAGARQMLDAAIESTKLVIGALERPDDMQPADITNCADGHAAPPHP